ncbi:MAG: DUF192 domain-containing protein [Myxococcota bacterium]
MKTTWIMMVLLAGCGSRHVLPTTTLTLGEHTVLVEVADDPGERARGLMHRDTLAADEGMLFVYPDTEPRRFWMKDTRIPLSIAFLDASGRIVKISQMEAFSTKRTASLYPARFAIEMNRGWFEAHGVAVGQHVPEVATIRTQE